MKALRQHKEIKPPNRWGKREEEQADDGNKNSSIGGKMDEKEELVIVGQPDAAIEAQLEWS